jgi:hypothetical protein
MTLLPIFEQFFVRDYGLYPGTASKPGLAVSFKPGLTLVLGANGLGKTTLVTMLYRMCTGPFDIPGLAGSGELGTRRLQARRLSRTDRRVFSARVVDGAESAEATLQMSLGESRITLARDLASLEITSLLVDGDEMAANDDSYQSAILEKAGLSSFGDWILLLQHLTFYFESRRALVWDPSAQRQILRILCLQSDVGSEWRHLERDIVERDSRMRNLQAALTREERAIAEAGLTDDHGGLRDELSLLERLQGVDEKKLADLNEQLLDEESARQAARLDALKAEAEHESAFRDLERQQLEVISAAFPDRDDTARYLIGKLFSDGTCLACGNVAMTAADALHKRQDLGHCVVCNTPIETPRKAKSTAMRSISRAEKTVQRAAEHLTTANAERETAERAFDSAVAGIQELNARIAQRAARIDEIVSRLPSDEAELHERRDELAALRGRVEAMKAQLGAQRSSFATFMRGVNRAISKHKSDIQSSFTELAAGFMLESCWLAWSPQKARLGETGDQITFPGFELELGGTDFPSPVRRRGPQNVSESQREFIDLAFRMALMRTMSSDAAGTLVIDAPESSLDAVFVARAADVLLQFARRDSRNRLLITSNLVEGDLIPALLRRAEIKSSSDARVVDLLKIAAPTAATRMLRADYDAVRRGLFRRAKEL